MYLPTPGSLALIAMARELISEAFRALDPETARYHMAVEEYAAVLAELKWISRTNVDSTCTGTKMNDYLRAKDLSHLPADLVARYDAGTRGNP